MSGTARQYLLVIAICGLLALLVMGGCTRPQAPEVTLFPGPESPSPEIARGAGSIRQIGSTTTLPLAEKWRDAFNKQHPGVNIAVSGGGSGTGLKALLSKTAEIANSSREIKSKELAEAKAAGINIVEHIVAFDGLAVIVHKDNPVTRLTVAQIAGMYTGKIKKWDEVGGQGDIQLINRDSASGTYESFKELVVQQQGQDPAADYAPGTLNQSSNQAIKTMVAQTKGAIGYVGLGYLDETVKVVPVVGADGQAVTPSVETIQSGKYALSRKLYLYTAGEPQGQIKDYFDFIKGPEGQALVKEEGFVPLPK